MLETIIKKSFIGKFVGSITLFLALNGSLRAKVRDVLGSENNKSKVEVISNTKIDEDIDLLNKLIPTKSDEVIVVDKENHLLHLFRFDKDKKAWIDEAVGRIGIGKRKGDKNKEGDLRTPEGLYKVINIENSKNWVFHGERDLYGPYFLRLNYPNGVDKRLGKSGSGIGIHWARDDSRYGDIGHGCINVEPRIVKRIANDLNNGNYGKPKRDIPIIILPYGKNNQVRQEILELWEKSYGEILKERKEIVKRVEKKPKIKKVAREKNEKKKGSVAEKTYRKEEKRISVKKVERKTSSEEKLSVNLKNIGLIEDNLRGIGNGDHKDLPISNSPSIDEVVYRADKDIDERAYRALSDRFRELRGINSELMDLLRRIVYVKERHNVEFGVNLVREDEKNYYFSLSINDDSVMITERKFIESYDFASVKRKGIEKKVIKSYSQEKRVVKRDIEKKEKKVISYNKEKKSEMKANLSVIQREVKNSYKKRDNMSNVQDNNTIKELSLSRKRKKEERKVVLSMSNEKKGNKLRNVSNYVKKERRDIKRRIKTNDIKIDYAYLNRNKDLSLRNAESDKTIVSANKSMTNNNNTSNFTYMILGGIFLSVGIGLGVDYFLRKNKGMISEAKINRNDVQEVYSEVVSINEKNKEIDESFLSEKDEGIDDIINEIKTLGNDLESNSLETLLSDSNEKELKKNIEELEKVKEINNYILKKQRIIKEGLDRYKKLTNTIDYLVKKGKMKSAQRLIRERDKVFRNVYRSTKELLDLRRKLTTDEDLRFYVDYIEQTLGSDALKNVLGDTNYDRYNKDIAHGFGFNQLIKKLYNSGEKVKDIVRKFKEMTGMNISIGTIYRKLRELNVPYRRKK